jgi:hypothetical protein
MTTISANSSSISPSKSKFVCDTYRDGWAGPTIEANQVKLKTFHRSEGKWRVGETAGEKIADWTQIKTKSIW